MTDLILPAKLKRSIQPVKSKDKAVGISPWAENLYQDDIIPKTGNWHIWYRMYREHAIVRAAIDKIAKTATNVGYDFVPRDSRSRIKNSELKILKDFFNKQVDFTYELRRIYKDLLIYGDAFMYIVPDRTGQPRTLKRLAPFTMAVQAAENGNILGYVQFDPQDATHRNYVTYEAHEIMHFKIDDPDNDLYGLSPLASLEGAVATDLFAQRYNAAFFKNSGITGTIVSVSGVSEEEIVRNRKFLIDNYTGPEAAHKPIFLEGDNIKVSKSVASHSDMNFLEGRKFIILEILAVLDVGPAKIGIMESANRSNSKEQDKTFRSEAISPLQNIVESVVNGQFVRPILGVQNTKFVHSESDTRDQIELMNFYTKGIAFGIYNMNEVRAKMGMAPVEGGDVNGIMTPTGFVPLDRMDLFFSPPQPNTDKVPPSDRDPAQGEPMPKRTVSIATGESRAAVKSAFSDDVVEEKYQAARDGIYALMNTNSTDRLTIIKAYSYFKEAEGVNESFDQIGKMVTKAKDSLDDPDLVEGYLQRAKIIFENWLSECEENYEGS